MKRFGLVLALLLTVSSGGAKMYAAPPTSTSLPEPTGKYGVGTIALPLVDCSRPGLVDAQGKKHPYRELMVQIWYPAQNGAAGKTQSYTDPKTADFLKEGFPGVEFTKIKTHALPSVAVADCTYSYSKTTPSSRRPTRYPVLVFSPGWGFIAAAYQTLFEELTSQGYIVVGVNHPGLSGITVMPNGNYYVASEMKTDTEINAVFQNVETDLLFVARQLYTINGNRNLPVAGHLDLNQLGVLGHSFGGVAAIQACIASPQYHAALNLDGALKINTYTNPIHKPVALIHNDSASDETVKIFNNFWNNVVQGYKVKVTGTAHGSFSDLPIILPDNLKKIYLSNSTIAPEQIIKITRDCVRTFFDIHLKHQPPHEMEKLVQKYPEITLEKHPR